MLAIDIKVSPELSLRIDFLTKASDTIKSQISAVVRDSAFRILANAKDLVPLSTGALRRSLSIIFMDGGLAAVIGSWLPYAARQEFDATLNHAVRQPLTRTRTTISGRKGTVIKGTGQTNPNATWGFLRKSLYNERTRFLEGLRQIARSVGEGWVGS